MADQKQKEAAKEVSKRTGRDPVILTAIGSVALAWYQYYIRGNKQHGAFIGLWAPTLLAFSNAVRINDISRKVEKGTGNLYDWLTQNG